MSQTFKIGDVVKYHLLNPKDGIPAVIIETHPNMFDSSIMVFTLFLKNTIMPKDDAVSKDLDHIPKGKFGTTTNVVEEQLIKCTQKEINKIPKKVRLRLLSEAKTAKKNKPKKQPKPKVVITKDYFVHPKEMFDGEYCSIGSVVRVTLTHDVETFGVITRVIKTNSDFLYDVILLSSGLEEAGVPICNVRPHRLEYVGAKDGLWLLPSGYHSNYTDILNRIQNGMFD